jgi:hypothetical protein
LEPNSLSQTQVHFGGAYDGPLAHVAWVGDDEVLRAVAFDVETATWGETIVVHEAIGLSSYPAGTADAKGNALIAHMSDYEDGQPVIHRYDAPSAQWTTTILPDVLGYGSSDGVHLADDGRAIAKFSTWDIGDEVTYLFYEYDPALATWSEATVFGPFYSPWWSSFYSAMDPATGAVVLWPFATEDTMTLRHLDPVSGEWTNAVVGSPGMEQSPIALEFLGDGRFLAVTSRIGDGEQMFARYFDGSDWQSEVEIASAQDDPEYEAYAFTGFSMVADTDGRALVGWFAEPNELYVRSFRPELGWSAPEIVNSLEQQGEDAWHSGLALALNGDGFMVTWHQSTPMAEAQAFSRRYDDIEGWDEIDVLDPEHPTQMERVWIADPLSHGRTRAVWGRRDEQANNLGYANACHEPGAGWSEPRVHDVSWLTRYEPRRDGDLLIVSVLADSTMQAEYLAPTALP